MRSETLSRIIVIFIASCYLPLIKLRQENSVPTQMLCCNLFLMERWHGWLCLWLNRFQLSVPEFLQELPLIRSARLISQVSEFPLSGELLSAIITMMLISLVILNSFFMCLDGLREMGKPLENVVCVSLYVLCSIIS